MCWIILFPLESHMFRCIIIWLYVSIIQICVMKNCQRVLYFETRKKKDLYMWYVIAGVLGNNGIQRDTLITYAITFEVTSLIIIMI